MIETKILLICPPAEYPKKLQWLPLGIAYLGSVLKSGGYDVKIRDTTAHSWRDVETDIKKIDPDIAGISCWTHTRSQSIKTARIAKKCNPNMKILMGGPHATFFPEHMFQLAPVDVVVMGEGEQTILELVDAFESNKNLAKVKGIAFKQAGRIVKTDPRPLTEDLDSIPFPMYDDFDLKKYVPVDMPKEYRNRINTHITTSRGCPFSCQFCSTSRYWGRRWRARSPKNVVDELEWLYGEYDVRHVHFFDDIFTLNKKRVIEICKEILNRKLDVAWITETRVDCLSREMLEWMKKAGCYQVSLGIESGSPKILKTINKGFTVDQIKDGCRLMREVGLRAVILLMVGNPGEDQSTIDETIKLLNKIKYSDMLITAMITWIFPNTPLYELAKSKGIITDDFWLTDNPIPYYTGDHTMRELIFLHSRLFYYTMSKKDFFIENIIKSNLSRLQSLPYFVRMFLT